MKILLFAVVCKNSTLGVVGKVIAQAQALGELGEDVFLLLADPSDGITLNRFCTSGRKLVEEWHRSLNCRGGFISKFSMYSTIYETFEKTVEDNCIEATYFRKITPLPCALKLLRWLKSRGVTVFFEYPTYPYIQELIQAKDYKNIFLEILLQSKLERLVDHFFIITDDRNASEIALKNWTRFSNGFDVEAVSPRSTPAWTKGDPLHCLALANVSFWHGFDRFIEGLRLYNTSSLAKEQQVILHVVGDGAELQNLRRFTEQYQLQKFVLFHGAHSADHLTAFFNSCHLGIGSLGAHRKGLSGSSELKMREYCARGLPFICAHDDPDFGEDFDFMKKFPANDSPISIEHVLGFADRVLSEKTHSVTMRKYALERLSWKTKMRVIQEVIDKRCNAEQTGV